MQRYLFRLFLFILPIAVLAYPLDLFLSRQLARSHGRPGESEVWNDIHNSRIHADVAIIGSSRAWVHFDTRMIEDSTGLQAYNFGIDGHDFRLQYLRHRRYLANNPPPRLILMSVDLFTLSEVKDLYGLGQFLPFMLFDTEVYSTTKDLHGFSLAEHFVPLVRYIGRRDQWKTADIIDPEHRLAFRYHGFRGMDLTWNNDLVNARNAQGSYEVTVHPKSVSLFHQFLKESKENGIEVVLVWTPEHVSGRHFVQNRSTVHGLHERIAEQYGLLFLDYTNDPICEDQRLFYNSLHLNKAGAERFTQKLIMDLQTHGRWPSTTRATS